MTYHDMTVVVSLLAGRYNLHTQVKCVKLYQYGPEVSEIYRIDVA